MRAYQNGLQDSTVVGTKNPESPGFDFVTKEVSYKPKRVGAGLLRSALT